MSGGKQIQVSTGFTNKRAAENFLAIKKAEVAEGRLRLVATRPPRLGEYAESFLASVQHPNTKKRYQSSVRNLLPSFRPARLSDITPIAIENFKEARLKAGIRSATVNRDLAVLRRMLNLAEKRRLIGQSPMREVEFLEERMQRRQPHILTFQEEARLTAVAPDYVRVLAVLILEAGLRVNKEALALKWSDIDFENSSLLVKDSKTPAGRRNVAVSEYCKAELLRWKEKSARLSEYVFPNFRAPRLPVKDVSHAWRAALKLAGIERFPIYNLRHTHASRLSAAGVSDVVVAQMIGHSTPSILQTYSKLVDDSRRSAVAKLQELRAAKCEGIHANQIN